MLSWGTSGEKWGSLCPTLGHYRLRRKQSDAKTKNTTLVRKRIRTHKSMDHDPLERSIAFRRSTVSAGIMLDESFVNPHCYFVDFLLVLAMRMRDKATKCRAPLWTKHIAGRSMEKWADEKQIKKNTQSVILRCTSNMDLLGQLWRREGGGRMVVICKTSAQIRIPIHQSVNDITYWHVAISYSEWP